MTQERKPDTEDFSWAYELQGTRQKEGHKEGYAKANVLASYLHMNFDGNPEAGERFVAMCEAFAKSGRGGIN